MLDHIDQLDMLGVVKSTKCNGGSTGRQYRVISLD